MKIVALNNTQIYELSAARRYMGYAQHTATTCREDLWKIEQEIFEQVFPNIEKQLPAKAGLSECGKFAFYID